MGDEVAGWAEGMDGHRVRSLLMLTRGCSGPDDLLGEIAGLRRRARQAIDRRRAQDLRWGTIRIYAIAVPLVRGGDWRAAITGVMHLGRGSEIEVEGALGVVAPTRVRQIAMPVLAADVRAHMVRAIGTTAGLREVGPEGIGLWYSAVDRHGGGGWRAISFSRGSRLEAAQ